MYNDFWYNVLNNVDNKDSFPIDVIAKDNMYEVYANLPGFSKDEISLNFDGGYLNISAKHKAVENKEHINYVIKERSLRAKKRSIYFGDLNPFMFKKDDSESLLRIIDNKYVKSLTHEIGADDVLIDLRVEE